MATKPEEDDVLNLTEEQQVEGQDDDPNPEGGADDDDVEAGDDAGADDDGAGDEEITTVTLGDAAEDDQEGDSTVIRQLRKELREAKARARETDKPPIKRERRPEPTMEDHAYDDEAFKADYKAWLDENAQIEREEAQANERNAVVQREWEADVQRFEQQKKALDVDGVEEAQDAVAASFDLAQQAVLVKAAENPALLMVALGKSPAKLAELAKIKDVIKLAAAIAKVEGTVKVTKTKRKAPPIDSPQRGSAQLKSSDKRLEELQRKADQTGDRTELITYKKQLADRQKAKK